MPDLKVRPAYGLWRYVGRTFRSAGQLVVVCVLASVAACHHGSTSPTESTNFSSSFPAGTLSLTVSPIDQSAIRWITPLGNLNPPSHTLPTDHIYFYFANPDAGEAPAARRVPFVAPGPGTVYTVLGGVGMESKIFVRQTSTFSYYLDHLILTASLSIGSPITAGQVLGTTGAAFGIDLGVINDGLTLGFINPARYNSDTLHADRPLRYFSEPVRSQLYSLVQRIGSDLDGKIDFDQAGHLVGNWFIGSGDAVPLVFTYDTYIPTKVMICLNTGPYQGVFTIAATDPDPRDVTVASGRVLYTLTRSNTGLPHVNIGTVTYLLVQMLDDGHVQEEMFPPTSVPTDFTAAARVFSR